MDSCTGTGNWVINWGLSGLGNTTISSNYARAFTVTYATHGTYTITLTYTCQGHAQTTATTTVNTNVDKSPAAPATFTVDASTGVVEWTKSAGADNYDIELLSAYNSVANGGTLVTLTPGNVNSADFTSASNATNCCINQEVYATRIRAKSGSVAGPWRETEAGDVEWLQFVYTGTTDHPTETTPKAISASWGTFSGVQTPVYSSVQDRIYLQVDTFSISTVVSCTLRGAAVSCAANTGVSFPAGACGTINASATVSVGTRSRTITGSVVKPCPATATPTATATSPPPPATATNAPPPFFNDPPPLQQDDSPRRSNQSSSAKKQPTARPTVPRLPTQDHSQLPAGAEIESDSPWIAFREVSGAAISNDAVRDSAIEAIDVMGPLGVDAEVCFDGQGSVLLLDTAYSPRRLVWLNAWQRPDGKTCARIDRAGTVALMPAAMTPTATRSPASTATPNPYLVADSLDSARALDDCMVSSNNTVLNFRRQPAGPILSLYMGASNAIARTDNWFKVRYLGNEGWISAHYVATSGGCD